MMQIYFSRDAKHFLKHPFLFSGVYGQFCSYSNDEKIMLGIQRGVEQGEGNLNSNHFSFLF
jgi:hypothetical protein